MKEILRHVCNYYKTNPDFIFSRCRKGEVIYLRHLVFYLTKHYNPKMSGRQISASAMDYTVHFYDHATLLNAFKKITNRIDTDRKIRKEVNELKSIISNDRYKNIVIQDVNLLELCKPRYINS